MPAALLAVALLAGVANPTLDEKVAAIMPTATEDKWMEIPWRSNVMRAVVDAQAQHKPLFFWVMNGSPLGAT